VKTYSHTCTPSVGSVPEPQLAGQAYVRRREAVLRVARFRAGALRAVVLRPLVFVDELRFVEELRFR
jgi:hypothetical protein